ncbi:MAG: PLP-dependent transferase [Planctomycetes bacterium]|nr:PLP-dependent transferase [Planctomycetota bacterium]
MPNLQNEQPLQDYLNPQGCPAPRPRPALFGAATQDLHRQIDGATRRQGIPYLHPHDPTLQLDMLGSRHMIDWQERKAEWVLTGERCWSDLHPFYARYGVEATRQLIAKVRELEGAKGAILADCGMQAVALTFDLLVHPGGHAILFRGVYNKTKRYLDWLASRHRFEVSTVDPWDYDGLERAIRPETFLIFCETYTNPLMGALDPRRLGEIAGQACRRGARELRSIVDDTIATPWGFRRPLLDFEGIDIVLASGTKALAGQDRDLWGYIASNRIDFLNSVMDLEAMRGGILDWRRARAILEGLDLARARFERRCRSAAAIARFLAGHPRVERTFHPSLPDHPDRRAVEAHYAFPGSLVSFKIRGAGEDDARRFADVLATCGIIRYAGSFDGLATKINHHRTVSEYFTPAEELERAGIDRVLRLAVGIEEPEDLTACLNWALWHHGEIAEGEVLKWQEGRERELGIQGER